ncbi:hypothetical protein L6R53_31150 [Myxococcota bacterium]|nr:hypothetical protein [Myxococcota bacterium]
MKRPGDTTAGAHAAQLRAYRRLGPERRLELGLELAESGRDLARAGIRARHPDYSDADVEDALRVMYLGEDLFAQAWPGRRVRQP